MGVQGLWQLIQSTGHPVTLESLEGKVLAVDVSIWLHKTMKGMRGADGNALPNAHLLGIFRRVCKLLFYNIKPIFVFDGTPPVLKKQTMAARRNKAKKAALDSQKASTKILTNYLKSQLIRKTLGREAADRPAPSVTGRPTDDMYSLPDGATIATELDDEDDDEDDDWQVQNETQQSYQASLGQVTSVDLDSERFRAMPSEVQHEILVDVKERRKHASWYEEQALPEESEDFSRYQLAKMMKQSKLTIRIDEIRKEMNMKHLSNVTEDFDGEMETQRLMSEDSGHYVLINKTKTKTDAKSDAASEQKLVDAQPCTSKTVSQLPPINEQAEDNEKGRDSDDVEFESKSEPSSETVTEKMKDPSSKRTAELRKITEKFFQTREVKESCDLSSESEDESCISDDARRTSEATVVKETVDSAACTNVKNCAVTSSAEPDVSVISPPIKRSTSEGAVEVEVTNSSEKTSPERSIRSSAGCTIQSDSSRANILAQLKKKIDKLKSDISSEESDIELNTAESKGNGEGASNIDEDAVPTKIISGSSSEAESVKKVEKLTESDSNESDDDFEEIGENLAFDLSSDDDTEWTTSAQPKPEPEPEPEPAITSEDREMVNKISTMTTTELETMADELEEEGQQLEYERNKQERVAATLSEQIHIEAQELLRLFGVPFVVSPTEAEAQCAHLDITNQCDGSVTDDSDIWLFGGKRVYKNMFNQDRHVEMFRSEDLKRQLALDRTGLINLAMLCGSDYTDGIQGVGAVSAMEIMAEFPGQGMDGLKKFRAWWDAATKAADYKPCNKVKAKLTKLELKSSFPSHAVFEAYLHPSVDESTDQFSWSRPDRERLTEYAQRKFGWSRERCDEELAPVMKKVSEMSKQRNLTSYFDYIPDAPREVSSKRLQEALNKARDIVHVRDEAASMGDGMPEHCGFAVTPGRGRKRGGKSGRGRGKKLKKEEEETGNVRKDCETNQKPTLGVVVEKSPEVGASEGENVDSELSIPSGSVDVTCTKVDDPDMKSHQKRPLYSPASSEASTSKKVKTLDKTELIDNALSKAKSLIQPHMNNRRRGRGAGGAPRGRGKGPVRGRPTAGRVVRDVNLSESSSSDTDDEDLKTKTDEERKKNWDSYLSTFS